MICYHFLSDLGYSTQTAYIVKDEGLLHGEFANFQS